MTAPLQKAPAAAAEAPESGLPREVTRPLTWGMAAIFGFLAAAILWSTAAPLTTSIHASGRLVSSLPNFEIQHGYGGEIAEVGVTENAPVEAGQMLFRLDTRVEAATRREIAARLARLEEETAVIRALLAEATETGGAGGGDEAGKAEAQGFVLEGGAAGAGEPQPGPALLEVPAGGPGAMGPEAGVVRVAARSEIARRYAREAEVARLRKQSLEEGAEAMEQQARAALAEADYLAQRLALLRGREEKQRHLLGRGLTRETEVDRITEQVLAVAGAQEQKQASAAALMQQAQKARADARGIMLELAAAHLRQIQQNEAQASQMRQELARLDAVLGAAVIVAPVSGHVQELRFDSPQMYAPRGQTLAVIAQHLEEPFARLTIPTGSIDQVSVGMRGKITINGLPQRELPALHATITAITPEAVKDGEGRAIGYSATARIDASDLEAAQGALQSRFRLAADMPVSATLTGRQITLWRYLTQPFTSAFAGAFED
ncbi:Type I secretion system membrane fusion protein PrsE [Pseudoruegeria aquimaris]|uniref:Type I secretion system membrane fusion protein PrsE n=1 Tax=Pseudoruegeria aquimaris TaxID=393663 RepID=A0A1Y5RNT8_9RHOB|nr:HlyD family efflux transporter periplasmic adaptor subunit [Pseudoruegeria aquimaris]SLN21928.1 Type I secretion system membrane fusion protein PrsE [Pseudoruegeria aquimaris]